MLKVYDKPLKGLVFLLMTIGQNLTGNLIFVGELIPILEVFDNHMMGVVDDKMPLHVIQYIVLGAIQVRKRTQNKTNETNEIKK